MQETDTMQRTRTSTPSGGDARQGERLMWLTPQRVFYAGLLGAAAERAMGGHGVYVSPAGAPPNRIRIGGGAWQSGEFIVVPPHVPHQVESACPLIFNLLIESESVDPARMPAFLQHCGPVDAPAFVQRMREVHAHLLAASARGIDFDGFDFDALFFDGPLTPRPLRRKTARPRCTCRSRASCICSSRRPAWPSAAFARGSARAACCAMCSTPVR
jgi:hypothetical protein